MQHQGRWPWPQSYLIEVDCKDWQVKSRREKSFQVKRIKNRTVHSHNFILWGKWQYQNRHRIVTNDVGKPSKKRNTLCFEHCQYHPPPPGLFSSFFNFYFKTFKTIKLSKLPTFNGPVEDLSISTRQDGNLHLQPLFWAWGGLLYKCMLVIENLVTLMNIAMLILKVFSWWIVVIFLLLPADLNHCWGNSLVMMRVANVVTNVT